MTQKARNALTAERDAFAEALLRWYRAHRRELPWRSAPSLYKTVVSEYMLQQTQVRTALPYFERWLRELPDFGALAAAPEERVLKLWEGLGYYARARNLRRLAQAIVERGGPPGSPEAWLEMPGIGPYTVAAIGSIAFGWPLACVDGNVVRILARLTADDTTFRDSATAAKAFAPLADALLAHAAPGDHNQAMMELGATVCTKAAPQCLTCPVSAWCAARREGTQETLPRLAPKRIEEKKVSRAWCERDGALLLHRAKTTARRLSDQYELPAAEHLPAADAARLAEGALLATRRRSITRYRIVEEIRATKAPSGALGEDLVWMPWPRVAEIVLSGPHRRWIEELRAERSRAGRK